MDLDPQQTVVFLTSYLSRAAGGMAASVPGLAGAMRELGFDVRILGGRDPAHPEDWRSWTAAPVEALRQVGPRAWAWTPGLGTALDRAAPSLVHAHGLWTYPSHAHRRWQRRVPVPYLVAPRGMLEPWALGQSRLRKAVAAQCFERAHLEGAACLHALTAAEAEAMRAYGLRNPICVVPNGIAVPEAGSGSGPPPWSDLLPAGAKVLLHLGRLHPKKGLPALLRAWRERQAVAEATGWWLVVAGGDQGGHAAELARLAAALGIGGRVLFVGPRFGAEKVAALRWADAFVLPSLSEGLPVAVLEAWACAKPVLMTAECNLPEGFAAGAALAMAPQPGSIATALERLFAMPPAEREAVGRRGRDLVLARFTWPRVAGQMAEVYRWLLHGGPAPSSVRRD